MGLIEMLRNRVQQCNKLRQQQSLDQSDEERTVSILRRKMRVHPLPSHSDIERQIPEP